jgi:hypothetical protein
VALQIPELKDILVGEFVERGDWVVANIEKFLKTPLQ